MPPIPDDGGVKLPPPPTPSKARPPKINIIKQKEVRILMVEYVGLDVHKRYCHATVMDEGGDVLFQENFSSAPEGLQKLIDRIDDDAKVSIEATRAWQYIYEELEDEVREVKLAHPKRTRIITDERIKTLTFPYFVHYVIDVRYPVCSFQSSNCTERPMFR